jgi:hypothetical protein
MTTYLKVNGNDSLVRDISSKAVINNNTHDYQKYIARKNAALAQQQEINRQAEELNNVKHELSEIKQMLSLLLSRQ